MPLASSRVLKSNRVKGFIGCLSIDFFKSIDKFDSLTLKIYLIFRFYNGNFASQLRKQNNKSIIEHEKRSIISGYKFP